MATLGRKFLCENLLTKLTIPRKVLKFCQIWPGKTKICKLAKQFAALPLLHPRETLNVFAHYKIPVSVLRYYKTSHFLPSYFFGRNVWKLIALLFQTQYNAKLFGKQWKYALSGNRNRTQKVVMSFPAFSLCDWINHRVIGLYFWFKNEVRGFK